jgi:hypothetical protein
VRPVLACVAADKGAIVTKENNVPLAVVLKYGLLRRKHFSCTF